MDVTCIKQWQSQVVSPYRSFLFDQKPSFLQSTLPLFLLFKQKKCNLSYFYLLMITCFFFSFSKLQVIESKELISEYEPDPSPVCIDTSSRRPWLHAFRNRPCAFWTKMYFGQFSVSFVLGFFHPRGPGISTLPSCFSASWHSKA